MIVITQAQKSILSLFQRKNLISSEKCMKYLQHFTDDQYVSPNVDVPMKHSIYNIKKNNGRTYILYNTLFNSIITLSDLEFAQYENLEFTDLALLEPLVNNGFLLPSSVDEYKRYDYYKQILSNQLPTPKHYTVTLTSRCNARCTYCYEEGILKSDMSMETAQLFVQALLNSHEEINITWFGGEPLLKTDLISYISNTLTDHKKAFKAGIITNGSLLTQELIETQFPIWNIEWVQITLDGMSEEYLKRKRYYDSNPRIFDTILENIEHLLSNKIWVNIRLNIDSVNRDECIKVARYMKDAFSDSSYLSVYPAFLYGTIDSLANENERIACASDIYALFPPEAHLLSSIPKVHPCFITQRHAIVIDTDGSVLACDGDIGRQFTKYADVHAITDFDNLEKPTSVIPKVREMCETCAYYPKCGGGCISTYGSSCPYDACFMERYQTEFLLNRLIHI